MEKFYLLIIGMFVSYSGSALADAPNCPNGRHIYNMIDEQRKITKSVQIVAFLAENATVEEESYFPNFTREAFIVEQLDSETPQKLPYALITDGRYIFKFTDSKNNFFFLAPVSPFEGKFGYVRPLYFDRKGASQPWFAETAIVGIVDDGFLVAINFPSGGHKIRRFPETIILTNDYKYIPYRYLKRFIGEADGVEPFYSAFLKSSGTWVFSECGS